MAAERTRNPRADGHAAMVAGYVLPDATRVLVSRACPQRSVCSGNSVEFENGRQPALSLRGCIHGCVESRFPPARRPECCRNASSAIRYGSMFRFDDTRGSQRQAFSGRLRRSSHNSTPPSPSTVGPSRQIHHSGNRSAKSMPISMTPQTSTIRPIRSSTGR